MVKDRFCCLLPVLSLICLFGSNFTNAHTLQLKLYDLSGSALNETTKKLEQDTEIRLFYYDSKGERAFKRILVKMGNGPGIESVTLIPSGDQIGNDLSSHSPNLRNAIQELFPGVLPLGNQVRDQDTPDDLKPYFEQIPKFKVQIFARDASGKALGAPLNVAGVRGEIRFIGNDQKEIRKLNLVAVGSSKESAPTPRTPAEPSSLPAGREARPPKESAAGSATDLNLDEWLGGIPISKREALVPRDSTPGGGTAPGGGGVAVPDSAKVVGASELGQIGNLVRVYEESWKNGPRDPKGRSMVTGSPTAAIVADGGGGVKAAPQVGGNASSPTDTQSSLLGGNLPNVCKLDQIKINEFEKKYTTEDIDKAYQAYTTAHKIQKERLEAVQKDQREMLKSIYQYLWQRVKNPEETFAKIREIYSTRRTDDKTPGVLDDVTNTQLMTLIVEYYMKQGKAYRSHHRGPIEKTNVSIPDSRSDPTKTRFFQATETFRKSDGEPKYLVRRLEYKNTHLGLKLVYRAFYLDVTNKESEVSSELDFSKLPDFKEGQILRSEKLPESLKMLDWLFEKLEITPECIEILKERNSRLGIEAGSGGNLGLGQSPATSDHNSKDVNSSELLVEYSSTEHRGPRRRGQGAKTP